jgi:hypothetical protein
VNSAAAESALIEDACNYLSPEYARSLWGKYVWMYQGKGHLRLTRESLSLRGSKVALEVPLSAITSIETGRFDWLAKPIRLAYIRLHYSQAGTENSILLVPAKSPFAPVWKTNELIANWIETMAQIEALSGRIKRPLISLLTPPYLEILL